VVGEYYDAAVSGADALVDRPGFAQMLARIEGNGIRVVLVEDASRFARDIVVQEVGIRDMRKLGVRVVTAGGIDLTDDGDTDDRRMIRQMLGVFAESEKRRLVHKLRAARDRASAKAGHRIEGRKGYQGVFPPVYEAVRELVAADPGMTLQAICDALDGRGFQANGKDGEPSKYTTTQVRRFIAAMELSRVDGRTTRFVKTA
jgi:DNA invertase Pin-like site-specific DNA recombinase